MIPSSNGASSSAHMGGTKAAGPGMAQTLPQTSNTIRVAAI
jgi:hypothetical protein